MIPSTKNRLIYITCTLANWLLSITILGSSSASVMAVELPDIAAEKVGEDVLEKMQDSGSVDVIITLQQPTVDTLEEKQLEIASMQNDLLDSLRRTDYTLLRQYKSVSALCLVVQSEDALEIIALNEFVVQIGVDLEVKASLYKSIPVIHADERHDVDNKGKGVVVAVIDTGIATKHGNLKDALVHEACFVGGGNKCPNGSDEQFGEGAAEDDDGHGTHVAGIIASKGRRGSVGVAPEVDIVAIKVLDNNGRGNVGDFIMGLDYIISKPELEVKIINMSLGGGLYSGVCDDVIGLESFSEAINELYKDDVLTVAASGNDGSRIGISAPACFKNVVAVAGSDDNDEPYVRSNINAEIDVVAPGVQIRSSDFEGGTKHLTGTSMAAPHVAACAALLVEAGDATSPEELKDRLTDSDVEVTFRGGGSFPRLDCGTH